jgi:WD40 repeat protein
MKCMIQHREADITDFCLDDRGRKVFLADHNGDIFVHNSETGTIIKKLTKHGREVSGMIYCPGDKNVITVSWDKSMMVHDESEEIAKVWRSAVNVHCGDISCVAFSRHLGLIATGSTDCVIAVREYERLRTLVHLLGHKSDITALNFVEPLPLLCSADVSGNVALWVVYERGTTTGKQHKLLTPSGGCMTEVLTRWVNMQSLESAACVNCLGSVFTPAKVGAEGAGRLTLYTGDEEGDIRVWDLSKLLEDAELEPVPRKADWDARRKNEMDTLTTIQAMARKAISPELPELKVRIDKPVVKQVHSWRAHSDSIRTLEIYSDPECLVTAGYDHMVKIWNLGGQLMTVLRAFGQIPWKFPLRPGNVGIDDETLDAVIKQVKVMRVSNDWRKQASQKKSSSRNSFPSDAERANQARGMRHAGYP